MQFFQSSLFFFQNVVDPEELVLPLSIALIFTFVIWILLGFILKNRIKSGFIVSIGLVIFFSYGHIFILLDVFQPNLPHFILIIPSIVLFGLGSYYFIRTKNSLKNATKIVNGIAVSLIVISLIGAGEYFMTVNYFPEETEKDLEKNVLQITETSKYPDVYYIILDGYAGSKSLQTFANFDNSNFLDFLTKKGFYIAPESFSNYHMTKESLASTLSMKYVNYLYEEDTSQNFLKREMLKLTRDNEVVKKFKSKGYTIYTIEAIDPRIREVVGADFPLCTKGSFSVTDFHSMLIQTTILNPIQGKLFSTAHREHILCEFSELSEMANRNDSPKFVLAHVMIPHQPYIFGPYGEPLIVRTLTVGSDIREFDLDLYLGQLQFANLKMKEVIEKLTDTENPPIIIIQSDHGMRGMAKQVTVTNYEKKLNASNNIKAYYFPDIGRNIEFETTTPVNSFRVLFNLIFDDEYELLEDKFYTINDDLNAISEREE